MCVRRVQCLGNFSQHGDINSLKISTNSICKCVKGKSVFIFRVPNYETDFSGGSSSLCVSNNTVCVYSLHNFIY